LSLIARSFRQFGKSLEYLPARRLQFLLDISVFTGAFYVAYLLRFEFAIPEQVLQSHLLYQLPLVIFVQFVTMSFTGVYNFIWRYISLRDLYAFVYAAIISSVLLLALRLGLPPEMFEFRVPISVIFFDAVLAFAGVLGIRLLRRVLYERYERKIRPGTGSDNQRKKPTLLVGAGRAGVLAAGELAGRNNMKLDVRGFVDDDASKVGAKINGVKVLGTTNDLADLVKRHGIEQVVITIARPTRMAMDRIVRKCEELNIKARIIPGLFDILEGSVRTTRIRDVQIEDLLGRPPVQLDHAQLGSFLSGKVIMVTGAGGSIGSELVKQLARFSPDKILLVERAEPALFTVGFSMRETMTDTEFISLLADVTDEARMSDLFRTWKPHLVFHAAAHKHVPLMEANVAETIKNNVFGTRTVARLAGEFSSEAFVLVSTDKAVNPTSVMGASKRVAELVVQDLNQRFATRYSAVRFGNVLGSTGSVIPIFRDQIKRGGPITVTHPEMKRYFMTIPEAAQLVVQAGSMGQGGEIFVLDMGKEVKIADLAAQMISLSGFKPHEEIEIVFSGIRPGEKLFEELSTSGENISKTKHPKIYIGEFTPYSAHRLSDALKGFTIDCDAHDDLAVRERLSNLLPEATLSSSKRALSSSRLKSSPRTSSGPSIQNPEFAASKTP
jgi:FlaA1/EpsC-like NDP-sugar epimerase